jgi:hypothetical protein
VLVEVQLGTLGIDGRAPNRTSLDQILVEFILSRVLAMIKYDW